MGLPRLRSVVCCGLIAVLSLATQPAWGEGEASEYQVRDTLRTRPAEAGPKEARRMLRALQWAPERFRVKVQPAESVVGPHPVGTGADALLTFPSPRPRESRRAAVNSVALEWYAAEDEAGKRMRAPAVLVMHILDGRMIVARAIARSLAKRGIHGFVMHMPGYAGRRIVEGRFSGPVFFDLCVQAVADARRARDAIAGLTHVQGDRVSIQGTSLGGFIAASSAALDAAFERNFIVLAGGDLYGMLQNGRREARMIRERLEEAGIRGDALRELCNRLDPIHLAHRLPPERTWLISAVADQVVPEANARALADAAGLVDPHHVWLQSDHYSAALHLPWMIRTIAEKVHTGPLAPSESPVSDAGPESDAPSDRPSPAATGQEVGQSAAE